MIRFFFLLGMASLILSACGSKKGFLDRDNADRSLQDAVKKLNKEPDNPDAREAIPVLYQNIKTKRLDEIAAYNSSLQANRWDKIVENYEYLQAAYDAIIGSPAAFKLVTPESYSTQLMTAKESAAEGYYQQGKEMFARPGRDNARAAYQLFRKASRYAPGYKDVTQLMQAAFEATIITVVINPVQDNSFFNRPGWGSFGTNYSNEYFQMNLLRDLSNNSNRYAAKFFNGNDARRLNIRPDWTIDFRIRNLDVPPPTNTYSQRNASAQVQIGTDTAGRPVYNTVYATINITRSSFTSRGALEMSIYDLAAQKGVAVRTFTEDYSWQQETATYSGDRRALSSSDWSLINATMGSTPTKGQVLNEIYNRMYPKVLAQIRQSVDW